MKFHDFFELFTLILCFWGWYGYQREYKLRKRLEAANYELHELIKEIQDVHFEREEIQEKYWRVWKWVLIIWLCGVAVWYWLWRREGGEQ